MIRIIPKMIGNIAISDKDDSPTINSLSNNKKKPIDTAIDNQEVILYLLLIFNYFEGNLSSINLKLIPCSR